MQLHQTSLKSQKGMGLLTMLMIILVVILAGVETHFFWRLNQVKEELRLEVRSGRTWLLESLVLNAGTDMSLRNSRFEINSLLRQCITAIPVPCDERKFYELALFPVAPVVTYQGGAYPPAPTQLEPIAGALDLSSTLPKVFYKSSGIKCADPSLTKPTTQCPLQAITRFKPLCGGNLTIPDISMPGGGPCAGPANGIEIHVGVGALVNKTFVFRNNSENGGDTQVFRYSSSMLYN